MRRLIALALALIGPSAAAEPITIGVVPSVPGGSTYLAFDQGWFAEAGLDVRLENIESASNMVPFLATNRVQVVQGGISAGTYNAIAQGLPIVLALDSASSPLYHDLLLRPDLTGTIRTVGDLKGRTVAMVSPSAATTYELAKVLETAGMTLKDVELKYVPFTQMGAAFANRGIEAALDVPPFGNLLLDKGIAVRFLDPDTVIRPTPMSIVAFMANTDWAAANADAAHRLFTVLVRAGREYCQAYHHGANRPDVVAALVKHGTIQDGELLDRIPWQARNPSGALNLASVLDVEDWFFREHYVAAKAPEARLVDASYAEAGAKALGPFELVNKASTLAGCR